MKVLDSPYFKHSIRSLQKRYFFEEFFYVCLNFQFTLICMLKQHNFHLTFLKVWILSILWKSTNYCRIKYFTEVRRLLARHSSVQNKFMEKNLSLLLNPQMYMTSLIFDTKILPFLLRKLPTLLDNILRKGKKANKIGQNQISFGVSFGRYCLNVLKSGLQTREPIFIQSFLH